MIEKIKNSVTNKLLVSVIIILGSGVLLYRLSSLYITQFIQIDQVFGDGLTDVLSSVFFILAYIWVAYSIIRKRQLFISQDKFKTVKNYYLNSFIMQTSILSLASFAEFYKNETDSSNIILMGIYVLMTFLVVIQITRVVLYFQKTLPFSRPRNYKGRMIAVQFLGLLAFILFYIDYFLDLSYGDTKVILTAVIGLILLLLFIMSFTITGKNIWVSELTQKQKWTLLFFTSLSILTSGSILTASFTPTSPIHNILEAAVSGSLLITKIAFSMITGYSIRFAFTLIATLPAGNMLKQKSDELGSLQYLNQIVAQSIDKSDTYLYETVLRLVMQHTGALAAWVELYDDKIEIAARAEIYDDMIYQLHGSGDLKSAFASFTDTYHFGSIRKTETIHKIFSNLPFEDMLMMPIFERDIRIGSVVVVHLQEYGFDSNSIKMVTAYGNNLKVALDNRILLQESVEKERLKNELMLARDMQAKIIPPVLPSVSKFDISAYYTPAVEVGGDYYDMHILKDGRPCLLSADVSGKGMTAAFYVAQLKGIVLSLARISESPTDLLQNINEALYGNMERNMFITITALAFDDQKEQISYARAGHTPIYLVLDGESKTMTPRGMGIGLTKKGIFNKNLEEVTVAFPKGSRCVLISDGILEMRNDKQEEFGEERLIKILNTKEISCSENISSRIRAETDSFRGKTPLHDDSTVVVIINQGK